VSRHFGPWTLQTHPRHFGTGVEVSSAELSGHIGTSAEMSYGHLSTKEDTLAPGNTWSRRMAELG